MIDCKDLRPRIRGGMDQNCFPAVVDWSRMILDGLTLALVQLQVSKPRSTDECYFSDSYPN